MTIAQLITFALIVLAFAMGRYSGYHDGYVKGRKAVRKYYESLQQVGR
jgi:mannose/fructose/N-acetylgalactosamine-specific phosphotransferase system component IID